MPLLGRLFRKQRNIVFTVELPTAGQTDAPDEIAVAAIFYNEAEYLREWIEFHLMVGVDRFYLYDNGSTDNYREVLAPYGERIAVIPWLRFFELAHTQSLAQAHAARNCAPSVKWLAYIDIDEFLFSETHDSIKDALESVSHCAAVKVPRFEYGFNGHVEKPKGLVIENYTRPAKRVELKKRKAKPVIRPDLATSISVHRCTANGRILRPRNPPLVLRINHYYSKSMKEFERRLDRGFSAWAGANSGPESKLHFLQMIEDNQDDP